MANTEAKNEIKTPLEGQWMIMAYCPECNAVSECAVWATESVAKIDKLHGGKPIYYHELYAQCQYCGGYPDSPILSAENRKRKEAAIADAEKNR